MTDKGLIEEVKNCPGCMVVPHTKKLLELVEKLEAKIKDYDEALSVANHRLGDIQESLCGQNLEVAGWHQNGDLEPLDSWFDENEWDQVKIPKKHSSNTTHHLEGK